MNHVGEPRWDWVSDEMAAIARHLLTLDDDGGALAGDLTPLRVRLAALVGDVQAVPAERRTQARDGLRALTTLLEGVEGRLARRLEPAAAVARAA